MNKMERKFGRYAIPNLMYYIVILYAVGVTVQKDGTSILYPVT